MAGRRHLCNDTSGIGVTRPGAFAEYIALPQTNVWVHKPGIDLDVASIFDPFGNATHSTLSFPVLGEDVLVTGATGGVGSMAVAILAKIGYSVVALSGKADASEYLKKLGAAAVLSREEGLDDSPRPLLKGRWAGVVDTVGGQYLATVSESRKLSIYSFADGLLSYITFMTLPVDSFLPSNISDAEVSWKDTGDYLSVGVACSEFYLYVLSFDGSSLVFKDKVAQKVTAVRWRPDSCLIAVGLGRTSQRLRIYEYLNGSLVEREAARVDENKTVFSVDWSTDGEYLVIGRDACTGTEFRTYYFDDSNFRLFPLDALDVSSDVYSVRWAHNNCYVATGDRNNDVSVFELLKLPLFAENAAIVFNSDVDLSCTCTFRGACSINCNGHTLDFSVGTTT